MSDVPPPSEPPPGWYPDPEDGLGFRRWDGLAWTDDRSESPNTASASLAPLREWMGELFRIVSSRAGHFFPMIVLLIVPTYLAFGVSSWYAFHDLVLTTNSASDEFGFANPDASTVWYVLAGVTLLVVLVAMVTLLVSSVRQVQIALGEEGEPWSTSMAKGIGRLPRALGLTAVLLLMLFVLFVMVVTVGAAPVLAIVTVPLWIVGSLLLSVRLSLTIVAASLAPRGVRCLEISWKLTRSHSRALFGRMAMLTLFSISLSLVMTVAATPFIGIVGGAGTAPLEPNASELPFSDLLGDNPAVFAIGQLFSALGYGAAMVLWAAGFVLLYRDLSGPLETAE